MKNSTMILEYNLQWFAKDGEGGEKTEPATAKKLNDAREEGKVAKSKELTSAFDLVVLFLVLKIFISYLGEKLTAIFFAVYGGIAEFVDLNRAGVTSQAMASFLMKMILNWMLIVLPFFIFGIIVTLLVSIYQVGWKVTTKPLKPKFDKFNPINGFKRILSKDSLVELLKSIIKIGLIFVVTYSQVKNHQNELFILYDLELNRAIVLIGSLILDTGLRIALVYMIVGVADFMYQKHKFNVDMKMTKQEVKDEYKNSEGDPAVKGQQKQRMREASQRRMMQAVPKADVVITNPTHLAVALQYEGIERSAPIVVAKGEDYLAQKIKEVAREHHIQIVENKPLARMLFHNVELGEEIPPELYQSVAEVLAVVYKMNHHV